MRPGYLGNYGQNSRRLGYVEPLEFMEEPLTKVSYPLVTGYIPEYMKYSKVFPNLPMIYPRRLALRNPKTFNVLMV